MGNYTTDQDYWGRPEDYTLDRPYYTAGDDVGATNLAATMTSALAATALVWKSSDTAYYTTLMTAATSLYAYATKVYGAYGDGVSSYSDLYHVQRLLCEHNLLHFTWVLNNTCCIYIAAPFR